MPGHPEHQMRLLITFAQMGEEALGLQDLIWEICFQSEAKRGLLFKWKGIVLQACDCVRRQNPRTGRKSSEGFFNSIWAPKDIQDRWAISVLCLPVPLLVDNELLFSKHFSDVYVYCKKLGKC